MKKVLTPILIFLLIFSSLRAQLPLIERVKNEPADRFVDHLYFGGSLGLQFGSQTYIELAPIVGYKITDRLSAGLGLKYIYYKFKDSYASNSYTSNIYGGGPFARFILLEGLFLHAEYEILNLEVPDIYFRNYSRKNISSVFLGAGYRQMIGNNSSLDFLFLYNINESIYSPYSNPVIRIGFGLGI